MFKLKSKKVGKYTRLTNREHSSFIQVARFGQRFASNFPDTDQGWLDATNYWYERDLADDGIEPLRVAVKAKTIGEAFTIYADEHLRHKARKTQEQYIYAMKFFFPDTKYLTSNLEQIQTAITTARTSSKVTDTTIQSYMRCCSTFFKWCVRKKYMKLNPIEPEDIPKREYKEPMNWEDGELERLFEYFREKDVEFYCLIRLLYVTSMRIHQALQMKWSNILQEEECIIIKRKGRNEPYYYPITKQVHAVLELLPKDREKLFRWKNISRKRLYMRLNEACKVLGIDRKGRAFHVFRKTRITKMAEKNILLTSQSSDVSIKVMQKHYIRQKSAKDMKAFLEQE